MSEGAPEGVSLCRWLPGWPGRPLRDEVLVFPLGGGTVETFDPLRERCAHWSALEVEELQRGRDPGGRLAAEGLLLDHAAEALRGAVWRVRRSGGAAITATAAGSLPGDAVLALAGSLPAELIAAEWREGERWRRLAVERGGGARYLRLPGLLRPEAAASLARLVRQLDFSPLQTDLLRARRCLIDDRRHAALQPWLDLLASEPLRALVGAVIARSLPRGLVVNAWRLQRGDFMGVHPDGRDYRGTFSLGLCQGWDHSLGGAIAFGDPGPSGFTVRERWYPHLGDGLLFAPDGDTWHAVEAVQGEVIRHSLTGWWTEPSKALSNLGAVGGA